MAQSFEEAFENAGVTRPKTEVLKDFRKPITVKDGEPHLNVSRTDKGIGRLFDPSAMNDFEIPGDLGGFPNMETYMCFLNTPGFPIKFRRHPLTNITRVMRVNYGIQPVNMPNYWSLIMMGMYYMLEQNGDIKKYLVESKGPITSYSIKTVEVPFGGTKTSRQYHISMVRYCAVLTLLRDFYNEKGDFTSIEELIEACKDKPEQDIWAKAWFLDDQEESEGDTSVSSETTEPVLEDTIPEEESNEADTVE